MWYAISWFVVAALLMLWSLFAWALHAAAVWAVSSAGALSGAASDAATMALPPWLAAWVPQEMLQWMSHWQTWLGPLLDAGVQFAPALAGGWTVLVWIVWGLGSLLLVLAGIGLHVGILLWRRRRSGSAAGGGPQVGRWTGMLERHLRPADHRSGR